MQLQKRILLVSLFIIIFYLIAFNLGDYEVFFYVLIALQVINLIVIALNFKNDSRRIGTYIMVLISLIIIASCVYMIVVGHLLLVGKGPIKV